LNNRIEGATFNFVSHYDDISKIIVGRSTA